jgi:hypothetical protein
MFDIVINSFLGEASEVTGCMPILYKRMGSIGRLSIFVCVWLLQESAWT